MFFGNVFFSFLLLSDIKHVFKNVFYSHVDVFTTMLCVSQ